MKNGNISIEKNTWVLIFHPSVHLHSFVLACVLSLSNTNLINLKIFTNSHVLVLVNDNEIKWPGTHAGIDNPQF